MTEVHLSSGVLMPPASYASQQSARKSRAHRKHWCGHETSRSKWQRKLAIFPAVVLLNAFDGRDIPGVQEWRGGPTISLGSQFMTKTHTAGGFGNSHRYWLSLCEAIGPCEKCLALFASFRGRIDCSGGVD